MLKGLATITPLIINDYELTESNFVKALMIPDDEYGKLKSNLIQLEKELKQDLNQKLTQSLMEKYFMANGNGLFPMKSGYFYGLLIIVTLISKGYSLKDLTLKSTEDIYLLYMKFSG